MPFQSYGEAVSSQLQNILAQRQAESRQKMLDSLNVANTQSEMADRTQNRQIQAQRESREASDFTQRQKTLDLEREATAAARNEATDTKKLAGLTRGDLDNPDAIALVQRAAPNRLTAPVSGNTLPSTQSVGESTLPGNPLQSSSTPTQDVPFTSTQAPSTPFTKSAFYAGNDKEIDKAAKDKAFEEFMGSPDAQKLTPLEKNLMRFDYTMNNKASIPSSAIPKPTHAYAAIDQATGNLRQYPELQVPEGTSVGTITRPPRDIPGTMMQDIGPDGKPTGKIVIMINGQPTAVDIHGGSGGGIQRPAATSPPAKVVPFKPIQPSPEYMKVLTATQTNPTPQSFNYLSQQAAKILNNSTALPHVTEAVKELFDTELRGVTTKQIPWFRPFGAVVGKVLDPTTGKPVTPDSAEYQQLHNLWTAATGQLQ